jgi:catechol 2,3-dioxygenase-like lactoylglutathione lyase family enzyme
MPHLKVRARFGARTAMTRGHDERLAVCGRCYRPSMRPQPLLAVDDVEATSEWFRRLLGARSDHGGPDYERLVDDDGRLILQLHRWEVEHHHGSLGEPDVRPLGHGVLLWFEVEDFDAAVTRAQELGARIELGPVRNPPDGPGGPAHRELWLRDPHGYAVVLASPDGEAE